MLSGLLKRLHVIMIILIKPQKMLDVSNVNNLILSYEFFIKYLLFTSYEDAKHYA